MCAAKHYSADDVMGSSGDEQRGGGSNFELWMDLLRLAVCMNHGKAKVAHHCWHVPVILQSPQANCFALCTRSCDRSLQHGVPGVNLLSTRCDRYGKLLNRCCLQVLQRSSSILLSAEPLPN